MDDTDQRTPTAEEIATALAKNGRDLFELSCKLAKAEGKSEALQVLLWKFLAVNTSYWASDEDEARWWAARTDAKALLTEIANEL